MLIINTFAILSEPNYNKLHMLTFALSFSDFY